MKRAFAILTMLILMVVSINAHQINNFKYIFIQHQEDAPKDIETRLSREFSELGFTIITADEFSQLPSDEQALVLNAEYRNRQSGECIFHLWLKNTAGEEIYEDEQISGAGFMSKKNDRQSALKKIFKEIKKLNYNYVGRE